MALSLEGLPSGPVKVWSRAEVQRGRGCVVVCTKNAIYEGPWGGRRKAVMKSWEGKKVVWVL